MPIFNRLPISFSYGKGSWLYDENGESYLDSFSGLAVAILGHAHTEVNVALQQQAEKLWHTSNVFQIPAQNRLAEKLSNITGLDTAFFCNSGAEANETAIKLSRLYAQKHGIEKPHLIVMHKGYHGRTLATLSASGNRIMQQGFEPLVNEFIHIPFNDIHTIEEIAKNQQNVIGIMVEPIQGNAGIAIPDENYLLNLRRICDQQGWLLILDEIQSGLARTGKFCAFQHANIKPDIITLAKGLANGLPIGACLAKREISDLFKPGSHGSTFGGNPLICTVALKVLEIIEREKLAEHAKDMGDYLLTGIKNSLASCNLIQTIRGKGLMIGIELKIPCKELATLALKNRLLINITQERIIRLLPALTFSKAEADFLIQALTNTINNFAQLQQSQVA